MAKENSLCYKEIPAQDDLALLGSKQLTIARIRE